MVITTTLATIVIVTVLTKKSPTLKFQSEPWLLSEASRSCGLIGLCRRILGRWVAASGDVIRGPVHLDSKGRVGCVFFQRVLGSLGD